MFRPTIAISPVNSSYLSLFTHWERKHIQVFFLTVVPKYNREWFMLILKKKIQFSSGDQSNNNTLTHSVKLQVQHDFRWSEPLCKCWHQVHWRSRCLTTDCVQWTRLTLTQKCDASLTTGVQSLTDGEHLQWHHWVGAWPCTGDVSAELKLCNWDKC